MVDPANEAGLLVGVNVEKSQLSEAVMVLNCKVGHLTFVYQGLPTDGNSRRQYF